MRQDGTTEYSCIRILSIRDITCIKTKPIGAIVICIYKTPQRCHTHNTSTLTTPLHTQHCYTHIPVTHTKLLHTHNTVTHTTPLHTQHCYTHNTVTHTTLSHTHHCYTHTTLLHTFLLYTTHSPRDAAPTLMPSAS